MHDTAKSCAPRSLCRRWKTCARCAKIRQARFADRAEAAAEQMEIPTYYVLVPDDTSAAGIDYARRFFVRQTRPAAGVWSVETGQFRPGFHLNVIAEWCEITGKFKGHIYAEPIHSHVRAVAAYMTKAERSATSEEGINRATGNIGNAADWLIKARFEAPIVGAAMLQEQLAPGFLPTSTPGPETPYQTARRWLDHLYQAQQQPEKGKS